MAGGRPFGATKKDLPWRAALVRRLELTTNPDKLDKMADTVIAAAFEGKMDAIREIAERLDGKPTPLIGVDEDGNALARLSDGDLAARLAELAKDAGVEIHLGIRRPKKQKQLNGE